jgi:hypothetical protein
MHSTHTCCSCCGLLGAAARQTTLLPQFSTSTENLVLRLPLLKGHSSSLPPASANTAALGSLHAQQGDSTADVEAKAKVHFPRKPPANSTAPLTDCSSCVLLLDACQTDHRVDGTSETPTALAACNVARAR